MGNGDRHTTTDQSATTDQRAADDPDSDGDSTHDDITGDGGHDDTGDPDESGSDSASDAGLVVVEDADDGVRRRYFALLDYLEELYRTQHPPVRDVASYQDFLLRESDAPWGRGIEVAAGPESAWLSAVLVPHPLPPALPSGLEAVVADAAIRPDQPPTVRREAFVVERRLPRPYGGAYGARPAGDGHVDEVGLARAQGELDSWIDDVWRPWSAAWHEVDRGRRRYKALHRLRDRLEHDRDAYELVWGFGRLRWRHPQGTIDHPLLTVPVEIAYERTEGRLEVRPAGPAAVEMAFLADLQLADRDTYRLERDGVERSGAIDAWSPDERDPILRRLLRCIDHDAVMVDGPPAGVGALAAEDGQAGQYGHDADHADPVVTPLQRIPSIGPDWVLYCRRRQGDYLGYLEAQRDLYRDLATPIPTALAALVADGRSPTLGDEPESAAEDLLLPLEANEEQHHILERARRSAGVTVQGPPGTGKSHTIANLICHFVAYGQRVLVTAEKEQPLSVLRGKLPRDLRPLAIAAIGSDAASHTSVEQSIAAIQEAVRQPVNGRRTEAIDRSFAELATVDRQIATTREQLRARHQFEVQTCPPAVAVAGVRTPSDLAGWLRDNEDRFGYIPDRIEAGTGLPLTTAEFGELVETVRTTDAEDLEAAARELPPASLPDAPELAAADDELDRLRELFAVTEVPEVADWSAIDAAAPDEILEVRDVLADAAEWCRKIAGSWLAAVRVELRDPTLATTWTAFAEDLRREREATLAHARQLQAHTVALPVEGPLPNDVMQALTSARERLASGKGLGFTAPRAVRQVLAACRVDDDVVVSAETVELCLAEAELRAVRRRILTRWSNQTGRVEAPALPAEQPEHSLPPILTQLDWLFAWTATEWPALRARLTALGIPAAEQVDDDEVARLSAVVDAATARRRANALVEQRAALTGLIEEAHRQDNASGTWASLARALDRGDWTAWDQVREEAARLTGLRPRALRFHELRGRLAPAAPRWTDAIVATQGTAAQDPADLAAAWHWRAADTWLHDNLAGPSVAQLQHRMEELSRRHRKITEQIAAAKAWFELARGFGDRQDRALQRFVDARKKLGKGHGKYAPRWRKEIRAALDTAKDAVPVWIMPANRALESFRPAAEPPFDVLIVDEASQVPLTAAPILGLAKRIIVVGDDQQTSPETVGLFEEPVHKLIEQYLPGIPDRRTVFDPGSSLYSLASARFHEGKVVLKEHFRCLPDIVGFSNQRYYHGRLIPLRDRAPSAGWRPLGSILVPDGLRRAGTEVNEPEARAVVELVARLVDDPAYDGMTVGVISLLGSKQAPLIHDLLLDRIGQDEFERRQLRCGEPPNFQGDERDVMILSLVVAPDELDSPLRIGPMTRGQQERRVNVAASRARNQMWVVHSVPAEDFPHGDPRRELLRTCAEQPSSTDEAEDLAERCQSELEREVLRRIVDRGYRRVKVQYVVGQYRIDIVVEGPDRRLAVECDGDAYGNIETWEADRARQAVLERAGWTFERIAGSAFFRDPEAALQPLWQRLDDLGIPTTTG